MHAFRKIKHNDQVGIMPGMLEPFYIYIYNKSKKKKL